MLRITVGSQEGFNEVTQEFVTQGGTVLELEHSLVSVSKWESIFEKPFLDTDDKTPAEILAYVRVMTLAEGVPEEVFQGLSQQNFEDIHAYIERKMSATWFSEVKGGPKNHEKLTSELIYYWMSTYHIPYTCETWHLNRLLTLIRVCGLKQAKPQKMSRSDIAKRNRELNARRQQELNTKG